MCFYLGLWFAVFVLCFGVLLLWVCASGNYLVNSVV